MFPNMSKSDCSISSVIVMWHLETWSLRFYWNVFFLAEKEVKDDKSKYEGISLQNTINLSWVLLKGH